MTNYTIEIEYKSTYNNGWPLVYVSVDGKQLISAEAKESLFLIDTQSDNRDMIIEIEHYGKNYFTDCSPDKSIEVTRVTVNGRELNLRDTEQDLKIPPWDNRKSYEKGSTYLGFNGKMYWIVDLLSTSAVSADYMTTTREVLNEMKDYFNC